MSNTALYDIKTEISGRLKQEHLVVLRSLVNQNFNSDIVGCINSCIKNLTSDMLQGNTDNSIVKSTTDFCALMVYVGVLAKIGAIDGDIDIISKDINVVSEDNSSQVSEVDKLAYDLGKDNSDENKGVQANDTITSDGNLNDEGIGDTEDGEVIEAITVSEDEGTEDTDDGDDEIIEAITVSDD